jgi:hypothetical protein
VKNKINEIPSHQQHGFMSFMTGDFQYFLFADHKGKVIYLPQLDNEIHQLLCDFELGNGIDLTGYNANKEKINACDFILKTYNKSYEPNLSINSSVYLQGKHLSNYHVNG